jgi:hypothetical protein
MLYATATIFYVRDLSLLGLGIFEFLGQSPMNTEGRLISVSQRGTVCLQKDIRQCLETAAVVTAIRLLLTFNGFKLAMLLNNIAKHHKK